MQYNVNPAFREAVNQLAIDISEAIRNVTLEARRQPQLVQDPWVPSLADLGITEPGDPAQWPKLPPDKIKEFIKKGGWIPAGAHLVKPFIDYIDDYIEETITEAQDTKKK